MFCIDSVAELAGEIGMHPRGISDFFDALVAMKFLERDGNGASARYSNTGLLVLPSTITTVHRDLIIARAAWHRLPAIYANDIPRGVDIFRLVDDASRRAKRFGRMNPQTQTVLLG